MKFDTSTKKGISKPFTQFIIHWSEVNLFQLSKHLPMLPARLGLPDIGSILLPILSTEESISGNPCLWRVHPYPLLPSD